MTNLADWLKLFLASTPEERKRLVEEASDFLDANIIEGLSVLKTQFDEDSYEELAVLVIQEVAPQDAVLEGLAKLQPLIHAYKAVIPRWILRAADRVSYWAFTTRVVRRIVPKSD